MYYTILNLLKELGMRGPVEMAAYAATLAFIALVCVVTRLVARSVLVRISAQVVKRTKYHWDDILYKHKVFHRLGNVAVPFVISIFRADMPDVGDLLEKAENISVVVVFVLLFQSMLSSFDEFYHQHEVAKTRPIKSVLQVVHIAVLILSGITAVAVLLGEDPLTLLGGIGALTAVFSFVFKDAILGFVAGIQLTTNDMIRLGDWIEMPGQSADGTVVELSLTTVKVENFNKTITSIPAYSLVSGSFINWRGMEKSGGRRIKRAIHIDAAGVSLCDEEMIRRFRNMDLLRDYIDAKLAEIEADRRSDSADPSDPVNSRHITNLGTFRAYIVAYLRRHKGIHKDMSLMVRQLDPGESGIPLEIYAFANTVEWSAYENIQADIFDHLYSVVSEFGLQAYQRPSSGDIRQLTRN